jgi:hypothetical protein
MSGLAIKARMKGLALRALVVGTVAFATAAAFSAYLKPGMLIEFANLVLCM